jgi:hypothetical protein
MDFYISVKTLIWTLNLGSPGDPDKTRKAPNVSILTGIRIVIPETQQQL